MKIIEVNYVKDPAQRKAYLVTQGPEASVVRFIHSGIEQCISNTYLGLPIERREGENKINRPT